MRMKWRSTNFVRRRRNVNPLVRDKYVKVMADYGACGIWEKSGCMANLEDLPVDPQVIFDLGQWQYWFEARRSEDEINSLDRFVDFGERIARDIKRELPDWQVEYFDEREGKVVHRYWIWLNKKS